MRRLVLASSMVVYGEGRYRCADPRPPGAAPRAVEALDGRRLRQPLRRAAARRSAGSWSTSTARLDPRSSYAASKLAQEHYAAAWVRQAGASAIALRYHNVYGPLMPRDTPYSGVAAMFRSSLERGEAPQVYEDGGQMRDFVHVGDVARANVLALGAVAVSAAPGRYAAYNVCSGQPVSILRGGRHVAAGAGASWRRRSPAATGSATSGTSWPRPNAPGASSASPRGRRPEEGLREFATAPLRPDPHQDV